MTIPKRKKGEKQSALRWDTYKAERKAGHSWNEAWAIAYKKAPAKKKKK